MKESLSLLRGPIEADDDFNLTVIRRDQQIVMGTKQHGFGAGKLVLPGGKTRYYLGESGLHLVPFGEEAAREASEETGLPISTAQLSQTGLLVVSDEDDTKTIRIYQVHLPEHMTVSSDELADIGWQHAGRLDYDQMPGDYRLWLPHIIAGYAVQAFIYSEKGHVVESEIFRQQIDPLGRLEKVDAPRS